MRKGLHRPAVRIAILLPYPIAEPGGISTYVAGLLKARGRVPGARITLIAPRQFRARAGRRFAQGLLVAEQLGRLLRAQADVVHTHEHPSLLVAAVAYQALARRPVRVVHTVHIDPVERLAAWKRLVLGWLLARCWAVTTVSAHTASRLANVSEPVPAGIQVIRGGAHLQRRQHGDPAVAGFCERFGLGGGPVISQMGPMNAPLKVAGMVRLIEAFALVRQRWPTARLLLVGDGHLRGTVEEARLRSEAAEAIVLTGFMRDVSIPLAATHVACHISFQDACPLSLLEAMLSGKPVVASRTGGIPEIVQTCVNGLLVGADPAEIAGAVNWLLEHPEMARSLAAEAMRTTRTRFTWQRVAAEFAAVYGLACAAERPSQ